jgi:hypothetical protein
VNWIHDADIQNATHKRRGATLSSTESVIFPDSLGADF